MKFLVIIGVLMLNGVLVCKEFFVNIQKMISRLNLVDPNLISASSYDGTLSIYTLMGGSCQVSRPVNNQLFTQAFGDGLPSSEQLPPTTTHDVAPIKYAPKWMRRQARVSFGVNISISPNIKKKLLFL
jgi:hypothetical protein